MAKKILSVVSLIIIVILAYVFGAVHQAFNEFRIGKMLTIVIQKNEIIDYTKITEPKISVQGASYPWFDMITDEDVQELVTFLKKNNFKIKSGRYEINQAAYFEDLIKKLSFEPITDKDEQIYKPRTNRQWDLLRNNKFEFYCKLTADLVIDSLMDKDLYFYCCDCHYLMTVDLKESDACYCNTLQKEYRDGRIAVNKHDDKILIYKILN